VLFIATVRQSAIGAYLSVSTFTLVPNKDALVCERNQFFASYEYARPVYAEPRPIAAHIPTPAASAPYETPWHTIPNNARDARTGVQFIPSSDHAIV
jgi:hypothetical protein